MNKLVLSALSPPLCLNYGINLRCGGGRSPGGCRAEMRQLAGISVLWFGASWPINVSSSAIALNLSRKGRAFLMLSGTDKFQSAQLEGEKCR